MFENIEKALTTVVSDGVKLNGEDEQVKKHCNGCSRHNKLQLR